MNDQKFQDELIKALRIENQPSEVQNELLVKTAVVAHKRLGSILPDVLSEDQLNQVEQMRQSGKSEDEIMDWVEAELPDYKKMLQATMLDIADEMIGAQPK